MENYEQKYKEALIWAHSAIKSGADGMLKEDLEHIFPELKESEDERIKREILELVSISGNGNQFEEIKDWLEKQGEQKPADKVEPKFHKGEWVVVNDGRIGRIIECTKDFADVDLESNCLSTLVNNIRSWTIQDAKDGDVLYSHDRNLLWIYKDKTTYHVAMILDYAQYNCISTNCDIVIPLDTCPATKEQRDILFQKMKEAGYEWDAENKELRKIEQNPTWSEEDEKMLSKLIKHFEWKDTEYRFTKEDCLEATNWLKSIKPQENQYDKGYNDGYSAAKYSHWKPSEEQMMTLCVLHKESKVLESLYNDLKSL